MQEAVAYSSLTLLPPTPTPPPLPPVLLQGACNQLEEQYRAVQQVGGWVKEERRASAQLG
jgi:hypothetical protein